MKILAVCGMGLGSSLMLRMTVEDVLKEEGIKGKVEVKDLGSAKSETADYIVASEEIAKKIKDHKATVIAINNMTSKEEVREKLISQIKNK